MGQISPGLCSFTHYTQGREKQHCSAPRWSKCCTSDDGGGSALPPLQGNISQPFQCCLKHMVNNPVCYIMCSKEPSPSKLSCDSCAWCSSWGWEPLLCGPQLMYGGGEHCGGDGGLGGECRRGGTGGDVGWKWWTTNNIRVHGKANDPESVFGVFVCICCLMLYQYPHTVRPYIRMYINTFII